jgi:hypothetical protein
MSSSGQDGDGNAGMIDALEIMIENLRKECYAKFANRDLQEKLKSKVKKLKKHAKEM